MSELLKNSIRFVLFILVQVFILFKMPPLHRFITPYLYYLFVLWLPFSLSRSSLTFISFVFGLSLDFFSKTPGLHAAACTLIAYVRPFIIGLLISQEGADKNYISPSMVSMGWAPYATYVLVLTLLHHIYLVFLEWMSFGSFIYFAGKVIASTAVSLLLVLLTELLFYRKQKFRTNTI
ncbi:MAG: rod shape-determining protein MreD [Bacteroidota bacterium]|nr:rod shape-determining protein MreD [Bacteroidota bacterium]MDP4214889.1 rod shape-determining protein MreD [Bacteroidota bacterium]MDP4252389.1 rod shape-determining protein MreD [Bacteroidota bacterium]MDP4257946.1 rod shape-determining protein MreD [Bacteroidota bacterium]